MPIVYRIFQDRKLVYAVGIDKVTYEDILLHIEQLSVDQEYIPPMKKLVDYRNTTLCNLSTENSKKIAEKKAQLVEKFRNEICAFVTKDDFSYGMVRFHGAHIDDSVITTNAFRNIDDALSWLQVNLDENEMELTSRQS
jgi:hypothetical protein